MLSRIILCHGYEGATSEERLATLRIAKNRGTSTSQDKENKRKVLSALEQLVNENSMTKQGPMTESRN